MSTSVLLLVLAAALLHATWNIIVKGGSNKLFELGLNALGAGIGACFFLPFLSLPPIQCWWLLAISCLFHLLYYFCMAAAYRIADLALAYTIMRGSAPMLTAFALFIAGIPLSAYGWGGVLLISIGILSLSLQSGKDARLKGVLYSLRTSLFIMAYTLADGFGARVCGDSLSFTGWLFFLNIIPINIFILRSKGVEYAAYIRKRGAVGLIGGCASLASYGVAIWAMTKAPIALVAALRETSVIFGMILAVIFLGERLTWARAIAALLVVSGAMLVRA